jgi:hypothetical protein
MNGWSFLSDKVFNHLKEEETTKKRCHLRNSYKLSFIYRQERDGGEKR